MEILGEQLVPGPRAKVWAGLNDPDVLRQCIPGCQSLTKEGEDSFAAVAEVKIGPIGARFKGSVTLSDIDAPNGYVITGQGNGGIAGSAKGSARVTLTDAPGGTMVRYAVEAEVGGRMAQLGGPIIQATAKNLAGKFFAQFGAVVTGGAAAEVVEAAAPVAAGEAPAVAVAAPAPALAPGAPAPLWGWVVAMVLVLIAGFAIGRSGLGTALILIVGIALIVATAAGYAAGRHNGGGK